MDERRWCIVLLLLAVHWWGRADCCIHSLLVAEGERAQALLR